MLPFLLRVNSLVWIVSLHSTLSINFFWFTIFALGKSFDLSCNSISKPVLFSDCLSKVQCSRIRSYVIIINFHCSFFLFTTFSKFNFNLGTLLLNYIKFCNCLFSSLKFCYTMIQHNRESTTFLIKLANGRIEGH